MGTRRNCESHNRGDHRALIWLAAVPWGPVVCPAIYPMPTNCIPEYRVGTALIMTVVIACIYLGTILVAVIGPRPRGLVITGVVLLAAGDARVVSRDRLGARIPDLGPIEDRTGLAYGATAAARIGRRVVLLGEGRRVTARPRLAGLVGLGRRTEERRDSLPECRGPCSCGRSSLVTRTYQFARTCGRPVGSLGA